MANYTKEYIRKIAEHKFGKYNAKAIENYIKNFNPASADCQADEQAMKQADIERKQNEDIDKARQNFRVEDYFINKFIYNFYTGEVRASVGGITEDNKAQTVKKLSHGDDLEKWLAYWVTLGFADKPMLIADGVCYKDAVKNFSDKYGVNINVESVASSLKEIAEAKGDRAQLYRQYYKCMFASTVGRLDDNNKGLLDEVIQDFDAVMQEVIEDNNNTPGVPKLKKQALLFGAMGKKELGALLTNFCEAENNLTKKANAEMRASEQPLEKVQNSVNEIIAADTMTDEDRLYELAARLQVVSLQHATHSKVYRFFHPFVIRKEQQTINNIKNAIQQSSVNLNQVEELSRSQQVYKPQFGRQMTRYSTFIENVNIPEESVIYQYDDLDKELAFDSADEVVETRKTVYEKNENVPVNENVIKENTEERQPLTIAEVKDPIQSAEVNPFVEVGNEPEMNEDGPALGIQPPKNNDKNDN